ncbi:glyoxalase [Agromyces sp. NPDC057865]|uniref:glyoxalase n=1 Tax=Agromyces sp. NPDC057865 TaxID=3346267 RepID=UPI00366F54D5
MDIAFVAGFGPIGSADSSSADFWRGAFGIPFSEDGGYFHTEELGGVNAFAIWPLSQAAEATFGTTEWPADRPVPQAWIEFDVDSPAAVAEAVEELRAGGHEILVGAHEESWGQTTSRLMSPEGLLVGVSYTPWMHDVEPAGNVMIGYDPELDDGGAGLGHA